MAIMNPYNYKKPLGVNITTPVPVDRLAANTDNNGLKNKADAYLEQKVMNAKPEELTMMLYEGLVKFINQTILFNDQKNLDKSNNSNLRSQAILQELRSSLNLDIELSETLEELYVFMIIRLIDANISKDNVILNEVLELATDLRDTWKQAMGL